MMNIIYSGIGLLLVAICGWGVIYYKRNRRKLKCIRMKRYLTTHPTNGIPSEYFIDAFERKFSWLEIEEGIGFIKIKTVGDILGTVCCKGGILKVNIWITGLCSSALDSPLLFLRQWADKEEWKAVSALMDCGCYCMKF